MTSLTVDDLAGTKVRTVDHDEAAALGGTAPDAGNDQTIVNATNAPTRITATGAGNAASVTGLAATVDTAHADVTSDALTSTPSAATTASTRARWAPTP